MAENNTYSKLMSYFEKIKAVSDKFETDLIASGRFKYLKTEGNTKIYIEKETGQEVTVITLPDF